MAGNAVTTEPTERIPVSDVLALTLPPALRGQPAIAVQAAVGRLAYASAYAQYRGNPALIGLEDFRSEALITTDPAAVEQFQPAHDCPACRAGNDQAMAHLREHPDEPVVLVNMHYTEVWRSARATIEGES